MEESSVQSTAGYAGKDKMRAEKFARAYVHETYEEFIDALRAEGETIDTLELTFSRQLPSIHFFSRRR